MIEMPLRAGLNNTHQQFSLRLGGNLLDFSVSYLSYLPNPAWSMNVFQDGTPLIYGAMLEPGAEISRCYGADIGRFFFTGDEVTLDNLGINNKLVWVEV